MALMADSNNVMANEGCIFFERFVPSLFLKRIVRERFSVLDSTQRVELIRLQGDSFKGT
jgi:hypothetical protein